MRILKFSLNWNITVILLFLISCISCQEKEDNITPAVSDEHVVLLISFDGFRYDYTDFAATPTLDLLAEEGTKAEGLIPVFPSKTFPNHYSQVTGLYPEHHGIISNTMYDSVFDATFTLSNGASREGRWYEGEPIWVTAEKQNKRTATYFWPGSDASIQDVRPTYYEIFNGSVPYSIRTNKVLEWLALPADKRPSFITLYYQATDPVGHQKGPDPEALKPAIIEIDAELKNLIDGIEALGMTKLVNIIVISDHGMSYLSNDRVIFLDDYVDLDEFTIINRSPVLDIIPKEGKEEKIFQALSGAHPQMSIHKKADMPEQWHYTNHRRIAPIIGVADDGWTITTHELYDNDPDGITGGNHGFDPKYQSMWGIFYAKGPDIQSGKKIPAFENIHLYELMCRLLNITPAQNDGNLSVLEGIMR